MAMATRLFWCSAHLPPGDAPLLAAVRERAARAHQAPFHIPGHKQGRGGGVLQEFRDAAGSALHHDLTELPGLDYLSAPTGPIAAAQAAAAAAFGADVTFLLVNGTTVGLHAAVLATCRPGDAVVLARNCHMSASSACVLAGCHPVWVDPALDARLGVAHGVTPEALEQGFEAAAAAGLRASAALLVSPTYFGACSDVAGCARVCHAAGAPLVVDEAHGAHLAFLDARAGAPVSALAAGADIAVQSSHKTLSALGQTSSPSYLLMASLDAARAAAQRAGAWREPLAAARAVRAGLRALPGLALLEDCAPAGAAGVHAVDPLRVTVAVGGWGLSGQRVAALLDARFGVVPELATQQVVVFALGAGSVPAHARALVAAFERIHAELPGGGRAAATGGAGGGGPPAAGEAEGPAGGSQAGPWAAAAPAGGEPPGAPRGAGGEAAAGRTSSRGPAAWAAGPEAGSAGPRGSDGVAAPPPGSTPAAPDSSAAPDMRAVSGGAARARAGPAGMSPREAFFAAVERWACSSDNWQGPPRGRVPADAAVGRLSAELLCPYPPGVPVALPGEALTAEGLTALRAVLAAGGKVTGAADESLGTLLVIAEHTRT